MVGKIILGTVQFGLDYGVSNEAGKPSRETVNNILDTAFERGINTLDVAEGYSDAQQIIGEYHNSSDNRFEIITKYDGRPSSRSSDLGERIDANLEELGVEHLSAYLFHSFEDFEKNYPQFETVLSELVKIGRIKAVGVSVYTNEELEQVLEYDNIQLIQLPFNLLDNVNQRQKSIDKAKAKGVEIHVRSVFLQGLFFMDPDKLSGNLLKLKVNLDDLQVLARETNKPINAMALQYVLQQPSIDRLIIGVQNVAELESNLKYASEELSTDLASKIGDIKVEDASLLNPTNWN